MDTIHVEEQALSDLRNALETAGEDYKANLARLQSLINEITSGDITGDPAEDLLKKFQDKETIFRGLAETIDKAEENMGIKKQKFSETMDNLQTSMR